MNRRFQQWLRGAEHASEDDLLLFLDGELPASRARQVERHLQSCWQCRAQAGKLQQTIREFVEHRDQSIKQTPPPNDWLGFATRLAGAAEPSSHFLLARQRFPVRLFPAIAAALSVTLFVWLWLELKAPRKVSAAEVLRNAETAEEKALQRSSQPVVYQKLRVSRRAGRRVDEATIETWNDPGRNRSKHSGGAEIFNNLRTVLRKNHMDERALLSPSAHDGWRTQLPSKREEVASNERADGSALWSVKTIANEASAVDAILEAGLVVRSSDWHVIEQSFRVQGTSDVLEFKLSEVDFAITERAALDPAIFNEHPSVEQPVPATPSRSLRETILPTIEADEIAIKVLFAIHQIGGCLGEPIELVRTAAGFGVRGLAETQERRDQIAVALRPIPNVQIEIETAEKAMHRMPAERLSRTPDFSEPAVEIRGGAPPIAERLKAQLTSEEITALSNRLLSSTADLSTHAWAVHRLEQGWPRGKMERLSPDSRRMFEEMVTDHTRALRNAIDAYRNAAGPVVTLPVPVMETQGFVKAAGDVRSSTNALFTASNVVVNSVDSELQKISNALSSLESQCKQIDALIQGVTAKEEETQ